MNKKKPGLSIGSILVLCLTAAVAVGCVFMFGKMRSQDANAMMDAERMRGLMDSFMKSPTSEPEPQSTAQTVTITLAPVIITPPPVTGKPAASPTPNTQANDLSHSFSLTAGGLMSFQSDISDTVYNKTDKTVDYIPVVSMISGKIYADMNLVTFPQVLNVADHKYGDYLVPVEAAVAIRACRFDNVVLGTEHILDQGEQGAVDTVSSLSGIGMICEGVNAGVYSQNRVVQLNGGRIAILYYTDSLTPKGKNTLSGQEGLMRLYSEETVRKDILTARGQGARCVIVCMYWGNENTVSVTTSMRKTATALAQMGADVILGSQPLRVLPMEIISTVDENGKPRDTFVAYSLGTFLSESRDAYAISGILLHMNIRSDQNGRLHFESIEYTPTYIWRQKVNGRVQYRVVCSADPAPEDMSDQQRDVMGRALTRIQNILKDSPITQR